MADTIFSAGAPEAGIDPREQAIVATMEEIVGRGLKPLRARHVAERLGITARDLARLSPWPLLRAQAYERVENRMIDEVYPVGVKSELVIETWLSQAFDPRSARAWQRWSDAWDMSCEDADMAAAFARVQNRYFEDMARVLAAGPWRLPDPEATAIRLFAIEDGLACQLLTCAPFLNRQRAEAVLRGAFEAECRFSAPA